MEVRSPEAAAARSVTEAVQLTRRRLMFRDGVVFLSLTAFAVVLAAVTTLLFRSFEAHREALADRWAERGRAALAQGHSADAVRALRTALSYRPDDREEQLSLAQALAASGRTVEAESYFLNLWQARPGDGPINLQLARLERSRGNADAAINYYRAAVFGTWLGDAPVQRRDTRLELSSYLVQRGEVQAAVAELTIAAGNNPDAATQLAIAEALEAAHDPKDALAAYRIAAGDAKDGPVADARAGELCYRTGDYACASDLLGKALQGREWAKDQRERMDSQRRDAERLQELSFGGELRTAMRVSHLATSARIAQARLRSCAEEHAEAMQPLQDRWRALDSAKQRTALRQDEDVQQQYGALIFESERAAADACGAPDGDDALLLYLRDHPMTRSMETAQ